MYRWAGTLLVAAAMVAGASGCQTMTGKTLGENIDDKTITAEVKAKLVADTARNLTAVDVDTNHGVVYLGGNATQAASARAEQLARQVKGVRGVVNQIQVAGVPPRAAAVKSTTTPAASPATESRHTITGQVTEVDHTRGRVALRTDEGDVVLYFPPASLQRVNPGDRVTVDLGLSPAR